MCSTLNCLQQKECYDKKTAEKTEICAEKTEIIILNSLLKTINYRANRD